MNDIEGLLTKFIQIKTKLQTKDINELTNEGKKSILSLLKSQTHLKEEKKPINKPEINHKFNENYPNIKTKDKTKFRTKKYEGPNKIINNSELNDSSPMIIHQNNYTNIPQISRFNQVQMKYGQQNVEKKLKKNINDNNQNNITNTYNANTVANINLLTIDNSEISKKDAEKIFEQERNEEENKKNLAENNMKNQQKNINYHNDNNTDNEFDDDFDLDDEIEKKKKISKNEPIDNKSLALLKKESNLDLNQPFNIFDMSNVMGVEEDNNGDDAYYEDKNENFNNNNCDFEEPKNIINKFKKNESENNRNKFKEKNEKKYENENNNNDDIIHNDECDDNIIEIPSNNNLKFCIEIETLNDNNEEKNRNNEYQSLNNNMPNENMKIIKNKKKENHFINPIKKNNIKSKSCLIPSIRNIDSRNNSKIKNNKIIVDDEDEKNYDSNNKNSTNELLLSPSTKNERNMEEKIFKGKESLISNKGTKFRLLFDNDITPPKVNKNKIRSNSTNNNKEDYDILCINTIHNILNEIEKKMKREDSQKKINDRCYQIINKIKNNETELQRRKKNTYLEILNILKILFSLLYNYKTCKRYINEIFQILSCIQKYYKDIKKYDITINNIEYYYKNKIAFKYIYSSLELKKYDNNTLKELTKKTNNEEINNNVIKLAKIYKRYRKTSEFLNKELNEYKEKINDPLYIKKYNTQLQNKYESCLTCIQTSPHFMTYMKLFNHYHTILNFCRDYNTLKEELEKMKKDKIFEGKREKSVQINRNSADVKEKNRERSRYKEREREKEIEKAKEKERRSK
jgi:hypothetical protein